MSEVSSEALAPAAASPAGPGRPGGRAFRLVRYALLAAALVFIGVAVARRWDEILLELGKVSPLVVVASIVVVLAGLFASMLGWRALLADLGTKVDVRTATRVLFLGQLSKYVPGGSVWSVVAQTELAREYGVSGRQSAAAATVHNVIGLGLGLLLAGLALPTILADDAPEWLHRAVLVLPLGVVCLIPPVLTRAMNLLLRLLRREPLDRAFTWGGVSRAVGYMLLLWLILAGHVYLICLDLGADPRDAIVPAIGGFALAWSAGFLAMVVPAGGGTRELLLSVALAAHLPGGFGAGLTVALVSRLVMTVADVVAALVGFLLGRGRRTVR